MVAHRCANDVRMFTSWWYDDGGRLVGCHSNLLSIRRRRLSLAVIAHRELASGPLCDYRYTPVPTT